MASERSLIVLKQNVQLTKRHLLRRLLQRRIEKLEHDKVTLRKQISELEQRLSHSTQRHAALSNDGMPDVIAQTMHSVRSISQQAQAEAEFTQKIVHHKQQKLLADMTRLREESGQLYELMTEAAEGIRALAEQTQASNALLVREAHLHQEKLTGDLESLYDEKGKLCTNVAQAEQTALDVQQQAQDETHRLEAEAGKERTRQLARIESLVDESQNLHDALDRATQHIQAINQQTQTETSKLVAVDAEPLVPEEPVQLTEEDRLLQEAKAAIAAAQQPPAEVELAPAPASAEHAIVTQPKPKRDSTGKTIAKNAGFLMVSQLTTWMLTLVLMLFLPRYLGPEAIGKLHFAGSLWAIVTIAIIFGMDRLLTKEIARHPDQTAHLFGTSVVARGFLYIFGFGAVALYLRVFDYPIETVQVTYILGLTQFVWLIIGTCQAALQGLEQMRDMSMANIVGKAVNTVLSIGLLLQGYGVLAIAAVTVVAAVVTLFIQVRSLGQYHPIRLNFDLRAVVHMLRAGSPYLLTRLSLVVYQQVDIIIISLLVNEVTIGWYGAADQLFGTFLFIPTVFMTAVFPALSRMYATGSEALPKLMSKSFDILLVLSVPIGLGLLVIANPLVVLLFGAEFAESGPVLAVLGIVLILTYQNILLGQFLVSTDRQNYWTVVMIGATIATIPLDLILIPWCAENLDNGAVGGALVFVITELAMTIAGIGLLPKGSLGWSNFWLGIRVFIAGLGMAAVAWWLRDYFIAIPIAAGQSPILR